MSVYTVHEPPARAADSLADPQRFVFVRDGFYMWGFLLTPLWMIRHRLWLVLMLYLLISIGLDMALRVLGVPVAVIALVGILISFLVGLEGGTLRRMTLGRRRWRQVGVVSGDGVEDAEYRFFDGWVQKPSARDGAGSAPGSTAPPAAASAPPSDGTGVIGLFPEPGAQR